MNKQLLSSLTKLILQVKYSEKIEWDIFPEDPKSGAQPTPDKIWWFLVVLAQEWKIKQTGPQKL